MNVVYIEGSSRREGNTEKMGKSFLEKISSLDYTILGKFVLRNIIFSECVSCYGCRKNGECVLKDDLTPVYSLLLQADMVIFASPIYFNSVSARSKMCIDRMQALWTARFELLKAMPTEKIGIFLTNGGGKPVKNQFTGGHLVMDYFFRTVGCTKNIAIEVSDTDKNPFQIENNWDQLLINIVESQFESKIYFRNEESIYETK